MYLCIMCINFWTHWLLYILPDLTLTNSTFCPHSVFMCFVWIWEQTAIISLYSNNWLVFITETECVYCAVRTGYLNVIWVICFIWIWEQTAIISLYNINWLVFITETECSLRVTFTNCTFCSRSVFMCFVWIWEQTAIISPHINWKVFVVSMECVVLSVRWYSSFKLYAGLKLILNGEFFGIARCSAAMLLRKRG